ncbi:hypothetical protein CARUB_v10027606mg [Capsella rubella]|uniref:F-box domain-containing protein n=1 Tax=Capsella rubella TaxID=81985 RepID=R0EZK6_9BRAS|nr:hypothetical protein CARUB_v10027606mg [Capsella rubella]
MSNSAATKEPPHKKRKMSPSPSSSSTLTSLPDDMVMSCLARTSRLDLAALSQVSKSYGTLVTSPDLYRTRSLLSCMENCLYVCLLTPLDPIPRCFILRRGNKSVNRLLCPIPSLPFQAPAASSVVAVDWGIYVIGGNVKGKCSKAFGVLDCRSNKWHRLPSMRVGRTAAAAGVVCGKIYVFGGCPDLNSSNWAEVFDTKTQTWDSLPLLQDPMIRCQYIHSSVVLTNEKEKAYAVYGVDTTKMKNNRRDWCFIGKCIYSIDPIGNLCWCEPGQLDSEQGDLLWKYVKGLGSVNESLSRSRLVHFDSRFEAMWESHKIKIGKHKKLVDLLPGARLSYSGPNIVLFWDVIEGDRFDMWCAEISLERRQGPEEMWGNIEWSNVVMTVDHFLDRYKVLHSVCVSL